MRQNVAETIYCNPEFIEYVYCWTAPYYDTSKEAVKRKLPNAVLITEELKQRFPCRNKSKKEK